MGGYITGFGKPPLLLEMEKCLWTEKHGSRNQNRDVFVGFSKSVQSLQSSSFTMGKKVWNMYQWRCLHAFTLSHVTSGSQAWWIAITVRCFTIQQEFIVDKQSTIVLHFNNIMLDKCSSLSFPIAFQIVFSIILPVVFLNFNLHCKSYYKMLTDFSTILFGSSWQFFCIS